MYYLYDYDHPVLHPHFLTHSTMYVRRSARNRFHLISHHGEPHRFDRYHVTWHIRSQPCWYCTELSCEGFRTLNSSFFFNHKWIDGKEVWCSPLFTNLTTHEPGYFPALDILMIYYGNNEYEYFHCTPKSLSRVFKMEAIQHNSFRFQSITPCSTLTFYKTDELWITTPPHNPYTDDPIGFHPSVDTYPEFLTVYQQYLDNPQRLQYLNILRAHPILGQSLIHSILL